MTGAPSNLVEKRGNMVLSYHSYQKGVKSKECAQRSTLKIEKKGATVPVAIEKKHRCVRGKKACPR